MASNALKNKFFDIIILDRNLPDGEGDAFFKEISGLYPKTSFVMMTGIPIDKHNDDLISEGLQDYIVKDQVDKKSLNRTLKNCVIRNNRVTRLNLNNGMSNLKKLEELTERMFNDR